MSDYFLPLYDWSLVPKETGTFKGHYMQFCGSCCHVPYILHLFAFNTRKPQQSPPCRFLSLVSCNILKYLIKPISLSHEDLIRHFWGTLLGEKLSDVIYI